MLYRKVIAVCSEIYTEHINTLCVGGGGYVVARVVEVLRYMPEGCGFDSR